MVSVVQKNEYVENWQTELQRHQTSGRGGSQNAVKEIGATADSVRAAFHDFQKFLYEETAA